MQRSNAFAPALYCGRMRWCVCVVCMCAHDHYYSGRIRRADAHYPVLPSLKLQVSFAEYHLFYRALLQKRPEETRADAHYPVHKCICISTIQLTHTHTHTHSTIQHSNARELHAVNCRYTRTQSWDSLQKLSIPYPAAPGFSWDLSIWGGYD